jgi:hypothetical protein
LRAHRDVKIDWLGYIAVIIAIISVALLVFSALARD